MKLLPHQITGANFLKSRQCALLADEMRVGKTPQTITAADMLNAKCVVVLCPAVVRANWEAEFERWSLLDRNVSVIYTQLDSPCPNGLTVCSYDLLNNERVLYKLRRLKIDVLVLDEAHRLKSTESKRSKNVYGNKGLIHGSSYTWALTGTPMPNNASELWTMLYTFGAYRYTYDTFIKNFCTGYHDGYKFRVTGSKNIDRLREILKPIMLRRTMKEVRPELPDVMYSNVVLDADDVDEEVWFPEYIRRPLKRAELKTQEDAVRTVLLHTKGAATADGLRAIGDSISTWRRYTGMAKIGAFALLIDDEFESGMEKVIIFAIHRDVIMALRQAFKGYNPLVLWGGTPARKKDTILKKFQNQAKSRVFIGQVNAAGEGINLMAAHDVFFLESSFVPGDNAQAAMRCHNLYQKHPVHIRFVSLKDSIDKRVQYVLRKKTEDITKLLM